MKLHIPTLKAFALIAFALVLVAFSSGCDWLDDPKPQAKTPTEEAADKAQTAAVKAQEAEEAAQEALEAAHVARQAEAAKEAARKEAAEKARDAAEKVREAADTVDPVKDPEKAAEDALPPGEKSVIDEAAEANGCINGLKPYLYAIRLTEAGRSGREFGVLHPRAIDTDLRTQAGWAAATVRKNYDRWLASGAPGDFIDFLGARYTPVGAGNDPDGLNRHWVKNVKHWYAKLAYA